MQFKAIIEMGPIFDYIQNTRKARDLWGASFLFSYLMGKVAHYLENQGATIERPALNNDQLYQAIKIPSPPNLTRTFQNVHAGTIPDQLFCTVNNDQLLNSCKNNYYEAIQELYRQAKLCLQNFYGQSFEDKDPQDATANKQFIDYFRIFYVYSDKKDFNELEQAAGSRGRIYEFEETEDKINTVSNKYERCLLCGDRKAVVIIKNVRTEKYFKDEPLCAICTIKRSMFGIIKEEKAFPSTTKVASVLVKSALNKNFNFVHNELMKFLEKQKTDTNLRSNLIDEIGKKRYLRFQDKIKNGNWNPATFSEIEEFIDFRNYFSTDETATHLRKTIRDVIKDNDGNASRYLPWLERPFYVMVAMDADGMGSLLRDLGHLAEQNGKEAGELASDLSRSLGYFANNVHQIIEKNQGVLFYAGGEDVLFMVHPAYLLQTVWEISQDFYQRVAQANANQIHMVIGSRTLTISAGAYICYHKHPLKLAIQGAHHQLDEVAKRQPGKNALAIQLYKGGGERTNVVLKNLSIKVNGQYTVDGFVQLVEKVNEGFVNIPRGFVYKLSEEYGILSKVMKNEGDLLNYVMFLFQKTRGRNGGMPQELQEMVLKSCNCKPEGIDYRALIHRLYFLRFLTGEGT